MGALADPSPQPVTQEQWVQPKAMLGVLGEEMLELEPPEGAETPSVWEHAGRGSPTQVGALSIL